jgi:small subunit ribosomal protein S1
VLNVGDEVTAKVLKFDQEKNRVSLGMKQLGEDPWVGIARRYPQGTRLFGKVTNLTDYGAFVEIEQGIEGLVHVSEMDWTNKNIHPTKVVSAGRRSRSDDPRNRRRPSPYLAGHEAVHGEPVGRFRDEPQEGRQGPRCHQVDHRLRHLHRPARWHRRPGSPVRPVLVGTGEEAIRNFKKGDEVEAVVLSIDVEKERISLGVKQMDGDPFTSFIATHDKNSLVTGTVKSVDAARCRDDLGGDNEGYLRASEFSRDRIEDLSQHLKVGDSIEP